MHSTTSDDYYALLGVHAAANEEELRKAWRHLAAQWHPDRAGHAATAKFQKLSAAYTVLCDPVARAAYDRRRRIADSKSTTSNAASTQAAAPSRPTATNSRPMRPPAPAVMLSRLTGSLSILLMRGAVHLDDPGFITLVLNQAEAEQGGMVKVAMRVDVWCPECANKAQSPACPRCKGSRKIEEVYSAWLAVPPGVTAGETLIPSADLPGMVEPVRFRIQIRSAK